jgi:hypothetical protein
MVTTPIQQCTLGRRKRSGVFLLSLGCDRFARGDPFRCGGFTYSQAAADFERFRTFALRRQFIEK